MHKIWHSHTVILKISFFQINVPNIFQSLKMVKSKYKIREKDKGRCTIKIKCNVII